MATAAANMDVPESQRLIALSLGKIAASRGQKGGINLHKNLLVATVLTKARAAYMIQHMNAVKQRAVSPVTPPPQPSSSSSTCVEMKEAKAGAEASSGTCTTTTAATTTTTASTACATSSPSSSSSPLQPATPAAAPSQSVTAAPSRPESPSVPEGAAGSSMQVAESGEDKENTPPPPSCRDAASPASPSSLDCEKRLQGEPCSDLVKSALAARGPSVSHQAGQPGHAHHNGGSTRDYVSRSSSTGCLLKRRRAMDKEHENVSAPKVRIVEARGSGDCAAAGPEPMQCDSPQISNLVNIFNTSFSGLSGAAGGEVVPVRNVGQSLRGASSSSSPSPASHKLSDNLTCAKEMKVGLDSLHHPLVLSV